MKQTIEMYLEYFYNTYIYKKYPDKNALIDL